MAENIPKLRFPGFTEPWEQRKLGEVSKQQFGGGTPSTQNQEYWSGSLPWFQSSDLELDVIDAPMVRKKITEEAVKNSAAKRIPGDSIAVVTRVGVGKLAYIEYEYSTSQDFLSLSRLDAEPIFLAYQLQKLLKEAKQQGTAIKGITKEVLLACKLGIPNLEEQHLIGSFFSNLSRLITLHQRKLDNLQKLKSGLVQKMFPRDGETVPEVRFPEFTCDWEQRKLSEIFDCSIPNNTLSRAELSYQDGEIYSIHYGDILIKYGSVIDAKNDEIPRIPGKTRDDFKNALLKPGDIIIADTAEDETTGKASEIGQFRDIDIVSGLHTIVCRPQLPFASGYLGYYLNSDSYHSQLLKLMQGIKVLSISKSNLQKTLVSYPSSNREQEAIAGCFGKLDKVITLHQRKLDHLNLLKQGLLQQMFV